VITRISNLPLAHLAASPSEGKAQASLGAEGVETLRGVKRQFLANVSHELRTPLNGIVGMIALLEKTSLDPEQQKYLGLLRYSVNTLTQLVNDILDFSRAESSGYRFDREAFSLRALIEKTTSLLDVEAQAKGLSLRFAVAPHPDHTVVGDPVRLQQVLSNLVMNAIKYTESGSVTVSERVVAEERESITVELAVSDTGMGIPEDKFGVIFESFTQLESAYRKAHRGLGIGLSIVRELVTAMGGTISLRSTVGVGSTFTVRLPLAIQATNDAAEDALATAEGASRPAATILIAEDEAINRLYVNTLLARLGYATRTAATGAEVLALTESERLELILMDVGMPILDGVETTRRIRERERKEGGHVYIIALTAHAHKADIDRCLAAGVDDYVTKPFAERELLIKIAAALSSGAEQASY